MAEGVMRMSKGSELCDWLYQTVPSPFQASLWRATGPTREGTAFDGNQEPKTDTVLSEINPVFRDALAGVRQVVTEEGQERPDDALLRGLLVPFDVFRKVADPLDLCC